MLQGITEGTEMEDTEMNILKSLLLLLYLSKLIVYMMILIAVTMC